MVSRMLRKTLQHSAMFFTGCCCTYCNVRRYDEVPFLPEWSDSTSNIVGDPVDGSLGQPGSAYEVATNSTHIFVRYDSGVQKRDLDGNIVWNVAGTDPNGILPSYIVADDTSVWLGYLHLAGAASGSWTIARLNPTDGSVTADYTITTDAANQDIPQGVNWLEADGSGGCYVIVAYSPAPATQIYINSNPTTFTFPPLSNPTGTPEDSYPDVLHFSSSALLGALSILGGDNSLPQPTNCIAVAVDPSGDVYVTHQNNGDGSVTKFTAGVWSWTDGGDNGSLTSPTFTDALGVDSDFIATGAALYVTNSNGVGDCTLAALSLSDGSLNWSSNYGPFRRIAATSTLLYLVGSLIHQVSTSGTFLECRSHGDTYYGVAASGDIVFACGEGALCGNEDLAVCPTNAGCTPP